MLCLHKSKNADVVITLEPNGQQILAAIKKSTL